MTHMEIKTLEDAGRTTMVWTEGYDDQTRHADVLKALAPALLILGAVAVFIIAVF